MYRARSLVWQHASWRCLYAAQTPCFSTSSPRPIFHPIRTRWISTISSTNRNGVPYLLPPGHYPCTVCAKMLPLDRYDHPLGCWPRACFKCFVTEIRHAFLALYYQPLLPGTTCPPPTPSVTPTHSDYGSDVEDGLELAIDALSSGCRQLAQAQCTNCGEYYVINDVEAACSMSMPDITADFQVQPDIFKK